MPVPVVLSNLENLKSASVSLTSSTAASTSATSASATSASSSTTLSSSMSLGSATTASLLRASTSEHAHPFDHPVNRGAIGADNHISSIPSSTSMCSPLMSRVSSDDCRS